MKLLCIIIYSLQVQQLITSELFPSSIRGRALGFATVITYCAAGLVSRTFLSLQDGIGLAATFSLYWIVTAVSIGFVCFGVPDTGGDRTPEEIDRESKDLPWINKTIVSCKIRRPLHGTWNCLPAILLGNQHHFQRPDKLASVLAKNLVRMDSSIADYRI